MKETKAVAEKTTPKKRWFFYLSPKEIVRKFTRDQIDSIKQTIKFAGKKSSQWLPRDLFKEVKIKYPHPLHTDYLIKRGIAFAKFPIVICPILVRYKGKRIEASIGLHPDRHIENFYLFNNPFPNEEKDGSVVFEIQGGELHYLGKYENVPIKWDGKRKFCPTGKDSLLISLVYQELAKLQFSGKYIEDRKIPDKKFVTLPPFLEEDLKVIYDILNEQPQPVS